MKTAVMGSVHSDGWDLLKNENFQCFEITNFSEQNLIKVLEDVDAILLRTSNLNSNILSKCRNLKIISRHGVGYDNVDIDYLNKHQIALAITSTSNAVSVAEHVLTCFLYLTKNINLSDQLTREGKFKEKATLPNFFELYKKNVLIFGFGRIGKEVAKRCMGFEANIFVFDPFIETKVIEEHGCNPISKIEGIKLADYISIHLPLNTETKNFISKKEFEIMKESVILVNSARGGIVSEGDLYNALTKNKIRGAGLDVFEQEPPDVNHKLFELPNILLSPHNAALTLECRKRMAVEGAENIIKYLKKKNDLNLNNIVNKKEIVN
jgi:D-3-phosphoglycerate dehydrogenase